MAPIQTVKDWVMCQYARKSVETVYTKTTMIRLDEF